MIEGHNETDFTLMRQSFLVEEPVYTSILDDVLVVVHINTVQSDRWWASPNKMNENRLAAFTSVR